MFNVQVDDHVWTFYAHGGFVFDHIVLTITVVVILTAIILSHRCQRIFRSMRCRKKCIKASLSRTSLSSGKAQSMITDEELR